MRALTRGTLTTMGALALGAAVMASVPSNPSPVLTGSGTNAANPNCNGKNNSSCTPSSAGPVKEFGVAVGPMTGIYPTGWKSIPLTFSNPHNFDIVVKTVAVRVSNATVACEATHLQHPVGVVTLRSPITVPKKSSRPGPSGASDDGQTLRVTLLNSAPDSCQNVRFPITVTATAVKR